MLRPDWERIFDPKDMSLWNSIEDIVMEYPYPEQESQALRLLDKYFRTQKGGSHNPERAWQQKKYILKATMDELREAILHKEDREVEEWKERQTRDESLETRLQREEDQRESSMKTPIKTAQDLNMGNSQINNTNVQDNKAYTDETGDGGVNTTKINKKKIMKLTDSLSNTNDPGEISRIQDQIDMTEKQSSFISFRHADAVQDFINYTDKYKSKDFSKYVRELKGPKKKKKKKKGRKKKSHFVPEKGAPNPLRRQYDYTGEKGGPNWIDRVEEHEKRRNKRKAVLKEILHVESQVRNRDI